MSQATASIANMSRTLYRAAVNAIVQAIQSLNSGATGPSETYPYMWWADTTSGWLKQRNAGDTAWIKRIPLGTGARVDVASTATLDLDSASVTSDYIRITGTTGVTAVTLADGQKRIALAGGAFLLTHGASLILPGAANYTTTAGDLIEFIGEASSVVRVMIWKGDGSAVVSSVQSTSPPVRQTVLSGPVDSNGFSAFGGSTGSTTVTASGTIKATAAAGGDANYTGSITNPSWTGLSTNGTMYLYVDITSGGVVTTGSTTLAPVYQWGGTYSTVNAQNTFNIQEMTMKAGNGSTAAQVFRVFVGEVTVSGSVVTAIVWYALMGRYDSGYTATLPGVATTISKNHNIGTSNGVNVVMSLLCTTADNGFSVGDTVDRSVGTNGAYGMPFSFNIQRTFASTVTGTSAAFGVAHKTTGAYAALTAASWSYKLTANRGW